MILQYAFYYVRSRWPCINMEQALENAQVKRTATDISCFFYKMSHFEANELICGRSFIMLKLSGGWPEKFVRPTIIAIGPGHLGTEARRKQRCDVGCRLFPTFPVFLRCLCVSVAKHLADPALVVEPIAQLQIDLSRTQGMCASESVAGIQEITAIEHVSGVERERPLLSQVSAQGEVGGGVRG
jgi:hypothetical protein